MASTLVRSIVWKPILTTIFLLFSAALASTMPAASLSVSAVTPHLGSLLTLNKLSPSLVANTWSGDSSSVDVLVQTRTKDYAFLVALVETLGGIVTSEFRYVEGLALRIPGSSLIRLAQNPDVVSIDPDMVVHLIGEVPELKGPGDLDHLAESAIPLTETFGVWSQNLKVAGPSEPANYGDAFTHGASALIREGITGTNSIVAIIDTGIHSGHFMIGRDRVLGGRDISPDVGTEFEGFDSVRNHWHGTAVAGVLGGFGQTAVSADGVLARSIEFNTGVRLPWGPQAGTKLLTLSGVAPGTGFFIVKTFPHDGAGVPTSVVVRALEVAIAAKLEEGLDIDIINMSLGGPTLFDGRGIGSQAVDLATRAGITVSIAAGNEGPSPMTVSDPGASSPAISSTAMAHPVTTRVGWDLTLGQVGIGKSLFVGDSSQVVSFSSRGPTADGRFKPDVGAVGVFNLAPFPTTIGPQGIALVSGTSFAAPATSGVVSLLNDFKEGRGKLDVATPTDYKRAVMSGAVRLALYTPEEQGSGFANAENALRVLKKAQLGTLPQPLTTIPQGARLKDISDIRNLFLIEGPQREFRSYTTDITLNPGHNRGFVFETVLGTTSMTVSLTNVQVGSNPNPTAQANFPNSFEVYVHDAKRGGSGNGFGYYIFSANVLGDASFAIRERSTTYNGAVSVLPGDVARSVIEPGFYKVVIEGDWTNAVPISARLTIQVTFSRPAKPNAVFTGGVGQYDFARDTGAVVVGPVTLGIGAVLKLYWSPGDYAHFPSSDVDFVVANTRGEFLSFQGATLNSPERALIGLPNQSFLVLIVGFEVNPPGAMEGWTLQVFAVP